MVAVIYLYRRGGNGLTKTDFKQALPWSAPALGSDGGDRAQLAPNHYCNFRRKIGQNSIGTSAFETGHALKNGAFTVKPALFE